MGFLSDLLFGKEAGVAPGAQEATQRAMDYRTGDVGVGTGADIGQARQAFGLGGAGGAGMGYLQNMMGADPFSSQAFQDTQQAMMGVMDERLTGLGSQLAGKGLLRGSGAERVAGDVIKGTMTQLGTMGLQAGMQSEGMRMQAAQFLPQMQMDQGRAFMGLGQLQAGMNQSNISNRLAQLGLGLQAGGLAQDLRTSGQQRGGGLWNMATDVLGGIAPFMKQGEDTEESAGFFEKLFGG